MKAKPKHRHDCTACKFLGLGRSKFGGYPVDLYFHPDPENPKIKVRHYTGAEGYVQERSVKAGRPDVVKSPELARAWALAVRRGFIKGRPES